MPNRRRKNIINYSLSEKFKKLGIQPEVFKERKAELERIKCPAKVINRILLGPHHKKNFSLFMTKYFEIIEEYGLTLEQISRIICKVEGENNINQFVNHYDSLNEFFSLDQILKMVSCPNGGTILEAVAANLIQLSQHDPEFITNIVAIQNGHLNLELFLNYANLDKKTLDQQLKRTRVSQKTRLGDYIRGKLQEPITSSIFFNQHDQDILATSYPGSFFNRILASPTPNDVEDAMQLDWTSTA